MSLEHPACCLFTLDEIRTATCDFSETLVIGRGGFGKVYKGEMNNEYVAVKRLFYTPDRDVEFHKEIETVSKIRHCRLISLIGYCKDKEEMILVYEYMFHGSLDQHLYSDVDTSPLPWEKRIEICIGAADGLHYLHQGVGLNMRVIHGDVKSANILLDKDFKAKISDFGLSTVVCTNTGGCSYVEHTALKFSRGYVDPQYCKTGKLTKGSDVYSFGMVLLEVLCGKKAFDQNARESITQGNLDGIVDPYLQGHVSRKSLHLFVNILLKCLHNKSEKRPQMIQVLSALCKIKRSEVLILEGPSTTIICREFSTDNGRGYDVLGTEQFFCSNYYSSSSIIDDITEEDPTPSSSSEQSPVIPEVFRCPICLELMKDPVIVSSGQTYDRLCIKKWLEAGHVSCPKTGLSLTTTALIPNYAFHSLITEWCKANPTTVCSPTERSEIETLLRKLTSVHPEDQRTAAGKIRLLVKQNADNRVAFAEAGAIPLLVDLLTTPDSHTQEHAVTALLNLSICEDNKGSIITSGAVPGIVHVLEKGSTKARENAAATLFSLSIVDENKIAIGASGAIPPLVTLLSEGTHRGKKDAATALFNLCIYQGNKGRAVRAGVVPTLMPLLTEPQGGMVDEALAILAILASHGVGKAAIGAAEVVPVLVMVVRNGSPRNRENATAILVHLCSGNRKHLVEAYEHGVEGPLEDLAQNGTDRGKRKAAELLECMTDLLAAEACAGASRLWANLSSRHHL